MVRSVVLLFHNVSSGVRRSILLCSILYNFYCYREALRLHSNRWTQNLLKLFSGGTVGFGMCTQWMLFMPINLEKHCVLFRPAHINIKDHEYERPRTVRKVTIVGMMEQIVFKTKNSSWIPVHSRNCLTSDFYCNTAHLALQSCSWL